MDTSNCPLCDRKLKETGKASDYGERVRADCQCCGSFVATRTAIAQLRRTENPARARSFVMHRVRHASERAEFLLTSQVLNSLLQSPLLPSPFEQVQNLILWLANHLPAAGSKVDVTFDTFQAIIGALDEDGFSWTANQAVSAGWLEGVDARTTDGVARLLDATLSLAGWEYAGELQRAVGASRNAFLAMQFGDAVADEWFRTVLAPAVAETGYTLRRLDDDQPAGLIDDQLRVRIRTAKFLLADLSHGNRGAYWEAGFAEGLGKPVIYLCREDIFRGDTPALKPHFDTNHLVTVIWSPDRPEECARKLKACIRATLPGEAVMEDLIPR